MRDGNLGPENVGPLLAVIVCGICVGFLPHNFHPARIFMGDAGAMLLGLLMAGSTLIVVGQTDNEFSGKTFFFFAPVFIPFFILGVPILDTVFAIIRRAGRRGVAEADKEHLHHRLMRLGHGQRRSVVILWAWTAVLSRPGPLSDLHQPGQRHHPGAGRGPGHRPLHAVPPGHPPAPRGRRTARGPSRRRPPRRPQDLLETTDPNGFRSTEILNLHP